MNGNYIFVDTNVLIGACINKKDDIKCLEYLYSLQGKQLFISALSIAQMVSKFQKQKTNDQIKTIIKRLQSKFNIIDFIEKDIDKMLLYHVSDLEDVLQYIIATKKECFYFVTNNKKDYTSFLSIEVIVPKKIRTIKQKF